jgi:two-component system, cell cycle response regulator
MKIAGLQEMMVRSRAHHFVMFETGHPLRAPVPKDHPAVAIQNVNSGLKAFQDSAVEFGFRYGEHRGRRVFFFLLFYRRGDGELQRAMRSARFECAWWILVSRNGTTPRNGEVQVTLVSVTEFFRKLEWERGEEMQNSTEDGIPVRSSGAQARPSTILVAEDDRLFRYILQTCLEKWGHKVILVNDGLAAWDALQSDDAPQMVIFGWMMPGLDGLELCRRIRQSSPKPYRYLLLLSAKDSKQDVVAALDAGADDYLSKPFDVDELRARIRSGERILQLQEALIQAHDELQFEAAHDRLTELWNRGAVLDALERESRRAFRSKEPLSVVMLDLDSFKKINDTHGHLIGDVVLHEVGRRLVAAFRGYDYVGRYGGEEFLAVVPGCGREDLIVLAERARQSVSSTAVATAAGDIPVTVSLGVAAAQVKDIEKDPENLLKLADAALYRAKSKGRNRVEVAAAAKAASV